jgi:hypothetical protein
MVKPPKFIYLSHAQRGGDMNSRKRA